MLTKLSDSEIPDWRLTKNPPKCLQNSLILHFAFSSAARVNEKLLKMLTKITHFAFRVFERGAQEEKYMIKQSILGTF